MSTLIPIDGGSPVSFPVRGAGEGLVEVADGHTRYDVYGAFQVRASVARAAREAFQAGQPVWGRRRAALQVGHTARLADILPGVFFLGLQVNGTRQGRYLEALSINGQRPAIARPVREALTVSSSHDLSATARASMLVRASASRPSRLSLTLRGTHLEALLNSLEVRQEAVRRTPQALQTGGPRETRALLSLDAASGPSFLILADLVDAGLVNSAPDGYFPPEFLDCRFKVAGVALDVSRFSYTEPRGRLGATLSVTLADPTTALNLITPQSSLSFEIGARRANGTWAWKYLMNEGRLAGRNYSISFRQGRAVVGPNDEITISSVDVVHDKFNLAPRRSVVMYDPWKVQYREVAVKPSEATRDRYGAPILPLIEPVAGLTAYQAAGRAYTGRGGNYYVRPGGPADRFEGSRAQALARLAQGDAAEFLGLGYAGFVTNIPDYAISRIEFGISGGWHEAAQALFQMYGPIYFVENNVLFIIDPNSPLPAGFAPRLIPLTDFNRLQVTTQPRDLTNAVLLTYKAEAWEVAQEEGIEYTYRFDQEKNEQPEGGFGQPGYVLTETTKKIRETRHRDDRATVIAEAVEQETVETHQTFVAGDEGGGAFLLTHRETTTYRYDGQLSLGHSKKVEAIIASGPDASLLLQEVSREICEIVWKQTEDDPFQFVQTRNRTDVDGLFYISQDTKSVLGPDGEKHDVRIRYPVLVAQANGIIEDDGQMGFGPVKRILEVLETGKGSQMYVHVRVVDCLTGTLKESVSQPRTGSPYTSDFRGKQRNVLLRDTASEALIGPRKPAGINAGELPRARAFELGWATLALLSSPPDDLHLDLTGMDFALAKGCVVQAQTRAASVGNYMVAGLAVTGTNLNQDGHSIRMSVEGVELFT
jgi:hypothetical protein